MKNQTGYNTEDLRAFIQAVFDWRQSHELEYEVEGIDWTTFLPERVKRKLTVVNPLEQLVGPWGEGNQELNVRPLNPDSHIARKWPLCSKWSLAGSIYWLYEPPQTKDPTERLAFSDRMSLEVQVALRRLLCRYLVRNWDDYEANFGEASAWEGFQMPDVRWAPRARVPGDKEAKRKLAEQKAKEMCRMSMRPVLGPLDKSKRRYEKEWSRAMAHYAKAKARGFDVTPPKTWPEWLRFQAELAEEEAARWK